MQRISFRLFLIQSRANSLFTEALREVEHLFARTCELETPNDDEMNCGYHSQHDRSQRDQILILCAPSDWTTALE